MLDGNTPHVVYEHIRLPNFTVITDYSFLPNGREIAIRYDQENKIVGSFVWNDPEGVFPECMDGVLQASATEYDTAFFYDYDDIGMIPISNQQYLGIPNIYRSLRANLYVTERNQTGAHNQYATNTAYDGTFVTFSPFYHGRGNANNMQKPWTWTAEITKYSPFNFEIENVNALGIYSSALYGYKNSLATAVANNARYYEIGFDGFENDNNIEVGQQRGHIHCHATNNTHVSSLYAHTGNWSLQTSKLTVDIGPRSHLQLQHGKKYIFSCWVRKENCLTSGNLGDDYSFTYNNSSVPVAKEPKVECWQRIEMEFEYDNLANDILELELSHTINGRFFVDDIRIIPADATFKSYIYNPHNYRLIAELDENNFATFYNYDEEGGVVQVKKETEKGIMTVKTTRQHLKAKSAQNQIH